MTDTAVVTGATGFIGRHLVRALRDSGVETHEITRGSTEKDIEAALANAGIVYHLAGANRPADLGDFEAVNVDFTRELVERLDRAGRQVLFVLASSTQAERGTRYGSSKLAAEQVLEKSGETVSPRIYRLPNVFGRDARPLYNSAVATFCHLTARGEPISIDDPASPMTLVHVDDVIEAFLGHREDVPDGVTRRCDVGPEFRITVGALAEHILGFGASRRTLELPDFSDPFVSRLYSTYLSYLPADSFAYDLERRVDARGTLAEFLKSPGAGQIFVSRTNPGVLRGNHWHSVKTEKFFVVEGDAVVRFRKVDDSAAVTHSFRVTGSDFRVLDIPPGYAHSIENVGKGELVVLFWASEIFDPARPDTHAFPVEQ